MLVPLLGGTVHVPSVIGADLGGSGSGSGYSGIDLGRPHEDLKAPEAHVGGSNFTKAQFLAELRPIRTVGGTALSGVVGAALGVGPR